MTWLNNPDDYLPSTVEEETKWHYEPVRIPAPARDEIPQPTMPIALVIFYMVAGGLTVILLTAYSAAFGGLLAGVTAGVVSATGYGFGVDWLMGKVLR